MRVRARVVWLLAGAGVAWVALLLAAPSIATPFAAVVYGAGALICHQIPERSFHLGPNQLPVCARCFGVYSGGALAALAVAARSRTSRAGLQASLPPVTRSRARTLAVAGALPTLVTIAAEWAGLWATSNTTRALAGATLGMAVAAVVIGAGATLHYDEWQSRRARVPSPPQLRI